MLTKRSPAFTWPEQPMTFDDAESNLRCPDEIQQSPRSDMVLCDWWNLQIRRRFAKLEVVAASRQTIPFRSCIKASPNKISLWATSSCDSIQYCNQFPSSSKTKDRSATSNAKCFELPETKSYFSLTTKPNTKLYIQQTMKFQLILIQLFWIPTILVEGFTSTTKKSFARPEHLRYANLERSYLFTADQDIAAQQLHEERIREQELLTRKEQLTQHYENEESPCQSSSCSDNFTNHHSQSLNNRHSSKDWLYNLRSLPRSSVLQEIKNPVLALAGWATTLSVIQRVLSISSNPTFQAFASNMCVPHSAHSFLVSSLGLLLVFRTNSAYQRFLVRNTNSSWILASWLLMLTIAVEAAIQLVLFLDESVRRTFSADAN